MAGQLLLIRSLGSLAVGASDLGGLPPAVVWFVAIRLFFIPSLSDSTATGPKPNRDRRPCLCFVCVGARAWTTCVKSASPSFVKGYPRLTEVALRAPDWPGRSIRRGAPRRRIRARNHTGERGTVCVRERAFLPHHRHASRLTFGIETIQTGARRIRCRAMCPGREWVSMLLLSEPKVPTRISILVPRIESERKPGTPASGEPAFSWRLRCSQDYHGRRFGWFVTRLDELGARPAEDIARELVRSGNAGRPPGTALSSAARGTNSQSPSPPLPALFVLAGPGTTPQC